MTLINQELVEDIYEDFVTIQNDYLFGHLDEIEYEETILKWTYAYYEEINSFKEAIRLISLKEYCIPKDLIGIDCPDGPCNKCYKEMPQLLINRIS